MVHLIICLPLFGPLFFYLSLTLCSLKLYPSFLTHWHTFLNWWPTFTTLGFHCSHCSNPPSLLPSFVSLRHRLSSSFPLTRGSWYSVIHLFSSVAASLFACLIVFIRPACPRFCVWECKCIRLSMRCLTAHPFFRRTVAGGLMTLGRGGVHSGQFASSALGWREKPSAHAQHVLLCMLWFGTTWLKIFWRGGKGLIKSYSGHFSVELDWLKLWSKQWGKCNNLLDDVKKILYISDYGL